MWCQRCVRSVSLGKSEQDGEQVVLYLYVRGIIYIYITYVCLPFVFDGRVTAQSHQLKIIGGSSQGTTRVGASIRRVCWLLHL